MKKIFGIALVLAVVTTLSFGSVSLAAEGLDADIGGSDDAGVTGEVNVTWDGTGWVAGDVYSGDDAETHFNTACTGSHISGSFTASLTQNTAYPYMGVDNFSTYIDAEVINGFIDYRTTRNDSYESMYGVAGQESYSHVSVVGEGSWGAMATGSWTNFAALKDCTYGNPHTANGYNLEAAGADYYELVRYIGSGSVPPPATPTSNVSDAWVFSSGSGLAQLHCLSSQSTGNTTYGGTPSYIYGTSLGVDCGCNNCNAWMASFHAEGTGYFEAIGEGSYQVTSDLSHSGTPFGTGITVTGDGSPGSASVSIIANWVNGTCDVDNYSMRAD
ncbi:MAG TPA: hypothetical protein G4N91_00475 [Dehalococcoidia bacterium]|nr:hypothetical protein [Dehalococcoidia bacterium]